eukprot:TRINITY_DN124898_c0_g1_i1.p1 TRINITY_DN124898_c0_g1~~TRINITY_DN124898_c0_g1_i1.p1  ORF type:complete len:378 (-),score=102.13 TRINITY_DN124898_c0_g1_i1:85-1218(-)
MRRRRLTVAVVAVCCSSSPHAVVASEDERALLSRSDRAASEQAPVSPWISKLMTSIQAAAGAVEEKRKYQIAQKAILADTVERAQAAEVNLTAGLDKAYDEFQVEVDRVWAIQKEADQGIVDTEKVRSENAHKTLGGIVNDFISVRSAEIKAETERADAAKTHRAAMREEVRLFRDTLLMNYCQPPTNNATWLPYAYVFKDEGPSFVSEAMGCPDINDASTCINYNKAYTDLREAWTVCGETEGCGRIMNHTINGRLYLRRRSDLAGFKMLPAANASMSAAMMLNYECMPLCPTTCQQQLPKDLPPDTSVRITCGHCASGAWQEGGHRCTSPTRESDMNGFEGASGNCPEGYADCRYCQLHDARSLTLLALQSSGST